MKDEAAHFVGSVPDHYERGLGPVIFADFASDMAHRVARLGPMRVLETAAGTGIVTRHMRNLLPAAAAITATDLNQPMLDLARQKFRPDEQVSFRQADATALPFSDASFDAVVCQFGLMFFPDKAKSYREAHRVLAPGGHYLFSVWDSYRYNPFAGIAHEVASRFFPTDPPQFYLVPVSCHEIDPIKTALIDAGFRDIEIAVIRRDQEIADLPAFARGLIHGNPIIDQIRARSSIDPDRIVDALIQALGAAFGTNPSRMPLQAMFYSATKL